MTWRFSGRGGMLKFGKKKGDGGGDAGLPAVAEGGEGEAAPAKKKLPLLFIVIPAALLVLGGGAGAACPRRRAKAAEAGDHGAPKKGGRGKQAGKEGSHGGGGEAADASLGVISGGPDGVVFLPLPDRVLNIQSGDGRPSFL